MEKKRILVVDDSRLSRSWCTRVLEKQGLEVSVSENGEEALRHVFSFDPDVVIMDLEMPIMDGLSAIKLLKSHAQTKRIPIIAFTSKDSIEEKVKVLEIGANDFLNKEADEAELVARVKSLLRVKLLEDELVKERDKFRRILDDLTEAVMIIDDSDNIIFANNEISRLLGIPPELVGKLSMEKLLMGSPEKEAIIRAIKKDELNDFELELEVKDGKRFFKVNATSVFLSFDDRLGKALVFRDVTQEKEMERMKSAFYSMIAHDLRSPISVITGYTSLLLRDKVGNLTETQKEFLEGIQDRVEAMLKLVDEFLMVAKLEASFVTLELREVDIVSIVEDVARSFSILASNKNIRTRIEVEGEIPLLSADQDKLCKVFSNLYDNALKYTQDGGQVEVRVCREDGGVRVEVSDTGIGIDSEEIKYVFDRFRRMSSAGKKRIKGTGLGLAIVKEIVEAHCGRVWVESTAGEGSTFYVFLPLSKEAVRKRYKEESKPIGEKW